MPFTEAVRKAAGVQGEKVTDVGNFDLIGYLEELGAKPSEGGSGPQMALVCPRCNEGRTLYVCADEDSESYGKWICYRCREEDEGGAGRTVVSLIAWIEELDFAEARMKMLEESDIDFGASIGQRGRDGARKQKTETESVLGEDGLPKTFVPIYLAGRNPEVRMPRYLLSRGVTVAQARKFGLGFCEGGETREEKVYNGRIVFPIQCPVGNSFTTRATNDYDKPKYLAGPGAGSMVYGWPQAKELLCEIGDGHFSFVEGPFDVLAVFRAGVPAFGIMSKHIGESELKMARQAGGTKPTLLLDEDALAEAVANVRHGIAMKAVERLPGGGDPGEATERQILEALISAEPLELVWGRWLRGRLKALKAQR